METKFTPGPWKIRNSVFGRFEFYIETIDQSHDKTFIGNVGGGLQSKEEIEANAKLIAAAPDLLEDLIEAEKILSRLDKDPFIEDALVYLRHGIKKATE